MLNILIDETRIPSDLKLPRIPKDEEWTVVRSYKEMIELVENEEEGIRKISIADIVNKGQTALETKTALLCFQVICEICIDKKWDFPVCNLHDSDKYKSKINDWYKIVERYI